MKRTKTKLIVFFIIFFIGILFGIGGMMTPPHGVIDGSVLILIGQIFVLAAGIYGFEVHFDIKKGQFDAGKKIDYENTDNNTDNTPTLPSDSL